MFRQKAITVVALLIIIIGRLTADHWPLSAAFAQSDAATLRGTVVDERGGIITGANVTVSNPATGLQRQITTNDEGHFTFLLLPPASYIVRVEREGFAPIEAKGVVLNVNDQRVLNIKLKIGRISDVVIVETDPGVQESPSVSTVVDRQFVENIPLNGRSFQSLILLTPGVTAVPGARPGVTGEFSVNGQRAEANYYTVDGVSANTGMNPVFAMFQGNGATPAQTTLGTTHSLVSLDALQEFRINTSTYSAEFGRTPGAQISFQTRSGANAWQGSLFNYFRNDVLDANNWFNNAAGLAKTALRQNDFGGTLGGPIRKNRTFLFFSYEGLRLVIPQPAFTQSVPDIPLRQNAPPALRPILNAFPIPNGPPDANNLALFTGAYSTPSGLNSYSVRIDHTFGDKLKVFGRYSDTSSDSKRRAAGVGGNPAVIVEDSSDIRYATIGATSVFSPRFINQLRFNFTRNDSAKRNFMDNFGGATPITAEQLFPGITPPETYEAFVFLLFGTQPALDLARFKTPQDQWNVANTLSTTVGSHTLSYGIDYRRISGANNLPSLRNIVLYFSPDQILANTAGFAVVQGLRPGVKGVFSNFSAFVQDEWRLTGRLHLSLGLRWDLNPPPSTRNGPQPSTLDQISNLATAQLAPPGTPIWRTDYRGFAPRIGLAYQLRQRPGYETMLRGGFGVFYDVGNAQGLSALGSAIGFGTSTTYFGVPFPLTMAQNTPPPPSTASPYNSNVVAFDPALRLPYALHWNVAIQQGIGASQTLTLSYVASTAHRLLTNQAYNLAGINPNFALGVGLSVVTNESSSNYNSLQAQFQRRLSRGLQVLASYTWSHAIDNLSTNQNLSTDFLVRGNADFDVRHNFSAALTYDVSVNPANPILSAVVRHWGIDLRQTARSALPVDINQGLVFLPNGSSGVIRPDLVPGVPIYISDPTSPGGRVVNFNAFTAPAGQTGTAPRNFVRGFDAWQTDLAIRREFPLSERLKLQFRAEAFNLLNRPNFGSINNSTSVGAALFGRASGTLNNSLGGLNALYQMGGPRSLQFALKLQF